MKTQIQYIGILFYFTNIENFIPARTLRGEPTVNQARGTASNTAKLTRSIRNVEDRSTWQTPFNFRKED
jgi:hypothetical protein